MATKNSTTKKKTKTTQKKHDIHDILITVMLVSLSIASVLMSLSLLASVVKWGR